MTFQKNILRRSDIHFYPLIMPYIIISNLIIKKNTLSPNKYLKFSVIIYKTITSFSTFKFLHFIGDCTIHRLQETKLLYTSRLVNF